MNNDQAQSKYFLTGFLLASALLIYATMTFVMIFIASLINSVLVAFLLVVIVGILAFYILHKFEQEQKFSSMAWYYVLLICLLGLLVSAISYLSLIAILITSYYVTGTYTILAYLIIAILSYVVIAEVSTGLTMLAVSFELREVHIRKFPVVYLLTVVTLIVISYVFKVISLATPFISIITICSILMASFYVLYGIRKGPVAMEIETLEDRYKFVIKCLIHIALSPVHIPICIKCRIQELILKIKK